jgi:cytidylate kinase
MTDTIPVLTIDGPSGSGKGTIARQAAQRLGWHMLDSGALYRVLGLAAERQGIDAADTKALAELASKLPVSFETSLEDTHILLNNEDITDLVRTETAGNAASRVAAVPEAREALLARQRAFLEAPGLVADGRDMGTVVFPNADFKVFLTASAEERAKRRHKQLKEKGISVNIHDLAKEIEERDHRDTTRSVSPLRPAADAVQLDTTEMGIDEVIARVMSIVGK